MPSFPRIQLVSRKKKNEGVGKVNFFPFPVQGCMFLRKTKRPGSGEDGEAIASSVLITVGCHLLNLIMATVG